jgi:hypothetical protein
MLNGHTVCAGWLSQSPRSRDRFAEAFYVRVEMNK